MSTATDVSMKLTTRAGIDTLMATLLIWQTLEHLRHAQGMVEAASFLTMDMVAHEASGCTCRHPGHL